MAGYEVHHRGDPAEVLAATGPFLSTEPVAHNVILTLLQERVQHPQPGGYWWVTDGEQVQGVAFRSPPDHSASLTPMAAAALDALVPAVAAAVPDLPGVIGEAATAAAFAGRWTECTGVGAEPVEGQRLYHLATLRPPSGVGGHLRPATVDELDLVLSWWRGLSEDMGLPYPTDDGHDVISQRIALGEIWLWDVDGGPVSMARLSAPAARAVRIGFVYTPPELRRQGYASASVAALSAHGLAHGADHCLLYTQLSNPTSNGIYRRLGYKAVAEILAYRFTNRRRSAPL